MCGGNTLTGNVDLCSG